MIIHNDNQTRLENDLGFTSSPGLKTIWSALDQINETVRGRKPAFTLKALANARYSRDGSIRMTEAFIAEVAGISKSAVCSRLGTLKRRWRTAILNYKESEKMFTIDGWKLHDVTELFNDQVDPGATEELVESEICADWNEGAEHQQWIDDAQPQEIVDWLASFYES